MTDRSLIAVNLKQQPGVLNQGETISLSKAAAFLTIDLKRHEDKCAFGVLENLSHYNSRS